MKTKILAVLCAVVFLITAAAVPVSGAEINHCKEFDDFASSIFLFGFASPHPDSSVNGMECKGICLYVFFESFHKDSYKSGEKYVINYPAFKAEASKYFDLSGVSDKFDSIVKTENNDYNAANDTISFYDGGAGDSYHFEMCGYIAKGNNVYDVYGYGADYYDDGKAPAGAVLDKDYITVTRDGETFDEPIDQTYKVVLRKNGNLIQFVSAQTGVTIPNKSTLIKPGDTVKSPKKPTKTTPNSNTKPTAAQKNTTGNTTSPQKTEPETPKTEVNVTTAFSDECGISYLDKLAFAEGTVVKAEKVTNAEDIQKINDAVSKATGIAKMIALEFTAEKDNQSVQPNGTVKVVFDLPDGYDPDNVAVYYVLDERSGVEKIQSEVNKEDRTITAFLPHFSTYVIVEKVAQTVQPTADIVQNVQKNNTWTWAAIIAGVLLAAAAMVVVVVVYKKKSACNDKAQ